MNPTYTQFESFRLPRQVFSQDIEEILSRIFEAQAIDLDRLPKKLAEQMVQRIQEIKEKGMPDFLVLQKLPGQLGYGVFLHPKAEPLVKGTLIAPYAGEVSISAQYDPDDSAYAFAMLADFSLRKKEHEQLKLKCNYHPRRIYAVNLDAEKKGNFTRFINHSTEPNVEAEIYEMGKNAFGLEPMTLEVIYKTKKKVMPGEQLLVCYEDEEESYWKPFGIKPFPMDAKTFTLDENLKLKKKKG